MKKFPFFLAVFMLVNSLCFVPVYAEDKVFEDDFSNGLSLWTSDNNEDFFVINDEKSLVYLSNDIYASSPLLCTQSFNGNNILEFDLLYPDAQEIGLYVNYKDTDNYYLVKWNTKNSKVYLIRRANGGEDEIILKKDCALKKDINTVCLEFFENKYVLKLNDKTVFSKDNLSFSGNQIGFFGKNGSYKIDNVRVSGVFSELKEDDTTVRRLNIPESSLSGVVDGTNSKTDFETRSAALPEEIDLVKPAEIKGEVEIFVSPKGDDTNPGTIEKPFKTIARAINQVYMENAVSPKPKGIVLYLREGDYILDDTIKLDSTFSGTAEYPIIISSYNGEDVKLSNGILINSEDLTSVKDKLALSRIKPKYLDKIRCINLKEEFSTKYNRIHEVNMYSGGVPLTLARYPNVFEVQMGNIIRGGNKASSGTVTLDVPSGVVYEMYDRRPLKWQETGEILWNGCFQATWETQRTLVKKIDKVQGTIETYGQSWADPAKSSPSLKHYYENVLEELDMPGEYFVDGANAMVYIYPLSDEKTTYAMITENKNFLTGKGLSNIVINGIEISAGGNKGFEFTDCSGILIQNSKITNTREQGIHMVNCLNSGVIDSFFFNTGFNDSEGILFTEKSSSQGDKLSRFADIIKNSHNLRNIEAGGNFVQNNFFSCPYGTNAPVMLQGQVQLVVSHNVFSACHRYAVYSSYGAENIIEYNESVKTPLKIDDAGTFYLTATGLPMAIHARYNYLHDPVMGGNGIYFDEGTSNVMTYYNVIDGYNWCAVESNGGRDIVSFNNIMIPNYENKYGGWRFSAVRNSLSYYNTGTTQEVWWASRCLAEDGQTLPVLRTGIPDSPRWQARLPRYAKYAHDQQAALDERNAGGYRGEAELTARFSSGFYVANNIAVGKNNNIVITDKPYGDPHIVENNFEAITPEDVGFVDRDNDNYMLKTDSPVWKSIPEFKNIDVSKTGLVSSDKRWKNLPEVNKVSSILPQNESTGEVYNESAELIWTRDMVADTYIVTVAKDADFTEIVETVETPWTSCSVKLPEAGRKYYWHVEAISGLKSISKPQAVSETFTFTTMTDEEIETNLELNTDAVDVIISQITKSLETIIEDGTPGNYKVGAKAMLEESIKKANKGLEKAKTQGDIEKLASELDDTWMSFQKLGVPRYVYLTKEDFVKDNVNASSPDNIVFEGDEISFDSQIGGEMYLKKSTGPSDVYCFKLKIDDFKQYMGITPNYTTSRQPRYWIIWKPTTVELQFNDSNLRKQTFMKTVDVSKFDFSDWVDVELGTVATEQGVWVTLKLNGETIIDFLDTETPVYSIGNFTVLTNGQNGKIHIKPADNIHDGQPVPSTTPGVSDMPVEYNN